MKFYFALVILILFSCNSNITDQEAKDFVSETEHVHDFSWLIGDWKRVNEQEQVTTYEHWKQISSENYAGFGYTLSVSDSTSDTVWQEHIQLLSKNQNWEFRVTGQTDSLPTIFSLIEIDESSFTCHSPENDFPTHINYKRNGDSLNAKIIGGDSEIPFDFVRM
ncbi:MAG: DUF6265 family protein [Crocinitomicaceae bacterium]